MKRKPFDETVRTTVYARGKRLTLWRAWLNGLWAWEVTADGWFGAQFTRKRLGWVLQQSEGKKWGCVPAYEKPEDEFEDIWYEYLTRQEALEALIPRSQPSEGSKSS